MKKISTILVLLIAFTSAAFAQPHSGSIQGKIITADHKPAEGVTVLIKNATQNAIAGNDGSFEIKNLQAGNYTLVVSLVGHKDVEQEVTIENGKATSVNIQLTISNNDLNEVVVVANKSSFKTNRMSSSLRLQTPILEIPQNVQVVTSKLIYNQQIFDMLEGVTRNVSGASKVEHWDNYARITMRGSNVGAFRNGMNVSTTWGPLTEDMSMVERIEFVKGPAGFMLANGDPSGFYNVVTKKPSGRTKGEVAVSIGSFDLYRATLDLDGKVTKDGKLLYRLNIMGQEKGSHRPYDFNNRYTIAPVLKYLVDDKTAITLEYTQQFSQVNVIGSNYLFSKKGYADLPKNSTIAEPNMAPTNMNERSILAIFDHKINNNWKFTAQLDYINYQQQGASLWASGFDPNNDSLLQRTISSWDILGLTKMGQMFVNGEVKTGSITHKILAGADMSNKEYYHDWNQGGNIGGLFNIYKPVYGVSSIPTFDRTKNIRERGVRYYNSYTGLYLQDELAFFQNKLRVTLAGRYTSLKAGDVYSGDAKNSKFTPRLGLSYSVNKNTALYFVSDQSFMENYGADWTGKSFDPIVGANLELGIKKDWFNGQWNTTISAYQITRKNVLTIDLDHVKRWSTDSVPQPLEYHQRQTGEQKTRGIEMDIKGKITDNLDVIINYAFTEAKVTKDTDPKVVGNQVAGSTRHIQNTWLSYRVNSGALNGLGISLGYQYQAKRSSWYVFDNTSQSLPDYFRLDGGISYQHNKIGFNLLVNNILNKYLYSGAPYPYGGFTYWQAEAGTNLRFSVNYKF